MRMNFKGRMVNRTKKVWVYRNLNMRDKVPWYSLMQDGRVVAHATTLALEDVKFIVRKAGQARFLREGRKNVHAFAVGWLTTESALPYPDETFRGMYTPATGFVVEDPTGQLHPVSAALGVTFGPAGMLVHDPV